MGGAGGRPPRGISMSHLIGGVRDFVLRTTKTPLGFIGLNVTTVSGILLVVLLLSSFFGFQANPYIGIVTFLILPAFFILGLLMIPVGAWWERRQAHGKRVTERFPVFDLNDPGIRNRATLIVVLTAVNLTIVSIAAYKGIEYMDSVTFCGGTCHPIMKPEFTVYKISPHARVRCVDCHIGPGANWFVKSKLSGTRQVFKQVLHTWPRPIEVPVQNLRPSRDTCEQCHWPEQFHGDRLTIRTRYAEDSTNTPLKNILLLKVGGGHPGMARGIHSHIVNRVYYRADASRQTIPWVRVERRDGTNDEFFAGGVAELPDSIARIPMRLMDCIDCHNRPTHIYKLPGPALDEAMDNGKLPLDLPYLKREAMAALRADYPNEAVARESIARRLTDFYKNLDPQPAATESEKIEHAVSEVQNIWSTYVYPVMNINWGTYPNNIGHTDFPGCFRCHDEEHATQAGRTISQDCTTCHTLLAQEEAEPGVLQTLFPEGQ
jgi:hypothetical protein